MKQAKIRSELSSVIMFIKSRMKVEKDVNAKKAWAEVGIELNKIYLHMGWHKK